MVCEPRAEFVKGRCGWPPATELVGLTADRGVIPQHCRDERVVTISMNPVGREQDFLLQPKVRTSMFLPELEKRVACLACRLSGGAAQLLGDEQCLVMIVRQRSEGGIALHR